MQFCFESFCCHQPEFIVKTNYHFLQRMLPSQGLRSFADGVLAIGGALASRHPAYLGRPCATAQNWEDPTPPGKGSA